MTWLKLFNRIRIEKQNQKRNTIRFRLSAESLEDRSVPAILLSSLCGYVYVDANNDGIFESNETPISGATVTLTGTDLFSAPVSLTTTTDNNGYYCFTSLNGGTYTIQEPGLLPYTDGKTTVGSQLSGTPSTDQIANIDLPFNVNGINNNFGELPPVSPPPTPLVSGDTATIGFWHNKNGQALIDSLNGGPKATNLATWLSTDFPDLYGTNAGSSNLTGKTNADVAALFLQDFSVTGMKTNAQILGAALAVYVTDSSLAGTAGTQYGFDVTPTGTGSATVNVGSSGTRLGCRITLHIRCSLCFNRPTCR